MTGNREPKPTIRVTARVHRVRDPERLRRLVRLLADLMEKPAPDEGDGDG